MRERISIQMPRRSLRRLGHYSEFAVEGAVIVNGENHVTFLRIDDCELLAFDLVIQGLGLVRYLDRGFAAFDGDGDRSTSNPVVHPIELAAVSATRTGAAHEREHENTYD